MSTTSAHPLSAPRASIAGSPLNTSVVPEPSRPHGLRGWVASHPLTAFLVLVFSFAYSITAVPILAFHGVIPGGSLPGKLHIAPEQLTGLLLTMAALFPATMIVTWATDGRAGVRRLLGRMVRWRVGAGWWLLALVGLPVLTVGFALLMGDSVHSVDPVDLVVSQLGMLAVNLFLVNVWEETAWAGFLQSRLERRHNIFVAALLTAVPFGFVHLPLAFFGEFTATSLAGALALYILLGLLFRPLLGVTMRGGRDSVLLVAVMHSVFNRTNNQDGIAATLLQGDGRAAAIPLALIVLTVVTAIVIRSRLSRAYRLQLDSRTHFADQSDGPR